MPIFGNQSIANRRNLYIAYYARTPKPTSPGRYHTALIVLPDPSPSTTVVRVSRRLRYILSTSPAPEFESKTATKYHVVNVPVADERGKGRISWELRVEKDDATVRDTPLRMRLVALMLVGVIEPRESVGEDETVEEIVRNVVIPKYADDRPEWRCTTWVFEALKVCDISFSVQFMDINYRTRSFLTMQKGFLNFPHFQFQTFGILETSLLTNGEHQEVSR